MTVLDGDLRLDLGPDDGCAEQFSAGHPTREKNRDDPPLPTESASFVMYTSSLSAASAVASMSLPKRHTASQPPAFFREKKNPRAEVPDDGVEHGQMDPRPPLQRGLQRLDALLLRLGTLLALCRRAHYRVRQPLSSTRTTADGRHTHQKGISAGRRPSPPRARAAGRARASRASPCSRAPARRTCP